MADTFPYLDGAARGYLAYVDVDTSEMLVARPGRAYHMRATEEGLPVPPADGRWGEAIDDRQPARPAPVTNDGEAGGEK